MSNSLPSPGSTPGRRGVRRRHGKYAPAALRWTLAALMLAALAALGLRNYLVFHSLVELFSVAVTLAVFLIAWIVRRRMDNDFLLFIALGYAAVGLLDLLHTLAFKGMGVFPAATANLPTQIWIAARYLQALCLLAAPLWLSRRMPLAAVTVALAAVTGALVLTIFRPWPWLPAFPDCYLEALTPFKIISEYIICGLLLAALVVLYFRRHRLDRVVFGCMAGSIGATMLSEVAFTQYVSVFSETNLLGHLLKVVAVYLAYKALVQAGLQRPFAVLFGNLSQSEQRYRSLVQMSPVAVFVNRANRIEFVNPAAMALFGATSSDQIVGRAHWDLFHPDFHPVLRERIAAVLDGSVVPMVETRIVQLDGSIRDVEAAAAPFDDSRGRAIQVVLHDITDRKQAQARLRQAAEELARSNRDLEQFGYIVSHDLQEPLRAVTGFMGLLQERFPEHLNGAAGQYIGLAMDGATRMSQMIRDLLDYSRVQSRAAEPAATQMQAVLEQARANCIAGIQEAQATVTGDALPAVLGDRDQLARLLQNLIGNAVKFRRPGIAPQVHVGARREDGYWLFHVRDNGIGIPADQAERVFGLFARLHGRDSYGGSGVGLAICRKIVERHNGKIWVKSARGQGTTVYFTLPELTRCPRTTPESE